MSCGSNALAGAESGMSETQRKTEKRVRPRDGGMVWREDLCAFECLGGCGEFYQVWKRSDRENPETMAILRETLIADHVECWEYDDPAMARRARKFRKRAKLGRNLRVARQRASWRGRE